MVRVPGFMFQGTSSMSKALLLAACGAASLAFASTTPVLADIRDYEFQLVTPEVTQANGVFVEVRLVNRKTGAPVPDAVIVAKRIDMAPDGMEMMASKIEAVPADKPGHYRFRTDVTMEGGWRLSLGAKVQGETGTLETRLILKAVRK
jgi:hypothetical protein